jgi:hypothetical protein
VFHHGDSEDIRNASNSAILQLAPKRAKYEVCVIFVTDDHSNTNASEMCYNTAKETDA